MTNLTGQSIGRYQVLERLGEGGMAVVYKARDTRLDRDVALKLIRVDQFGSAILDQILKRFEREAKSLARLSHPSIVTVYDYGEHNGAPYLVLEYCSSGDLKSRLRGKPVDWREAVQLVLPVARALRYSHRQGVIHRDVKPSNIMFSGEGEPKLSDFGIAKILEHEEAATLTGTGVGIGTPGYMAPEQWTGETSPQSDQYGLGVVLYELLTGRKPYESDTPAGILIKQTSQPLSLPSVSVPTIPSDVEAALVKSLERDSAMRYTDMAEFINVFEGLLQKTPVVDAKQTAADEPETPIDPYKTLEVVPVMAASSRTLTPSDWETTATPVPGKQRVNWKMIAIGGAAFVVLAGVVWGGMQFSKSFPAVQKPSETPTISASMTSTKIPSKTRTPTFTLTIVPSSTSTPTTKPTPLGGGNRIGYSSYESGKYEIYTMLSDGSQRNQINLPEGDFWSLKWSPVSKKIAYGAFDTKNKISLAYVTNLDGSDVQSIDLPCKDCRFMDWFPDGEKLILYATRTDLGTYLYYLINLDGTGVTPIKDFADAWGNSNISLSPDGSKIAYVAESGVYDAFYINIANPDFSNTTRLTSHTGAYRNPVWSTIEDRILYIKGYPWNSSEHGLSEIRLIGVDGSGERTIVKLPFIAGNMTLSPDGSKILLSGNSQKINDTGNYAADWTDPGSFIVNIEGGERTKVADQALWSPVWSPDGSKILFSSYSGNSEDIYIINPDGTGLVNLTNQPGSYFNLAWLPEP